jgi:phage terminase small subunit
MSLTPRQAKFVEAYAIDRNAARAARTAGYSATGAKVTACRLLTKANVKAALAAKEAELARQMDVTKQRVIGELRAAAEDARSQAKPAAVISAWVQIGHLCGHYAPEPVMAAPSAKGKALMAKFQAMSDEELMALAEGRQPPP